MAVMIELFGLPGSGKSFLANGLSAVLANSGVRVLMRSEAVKLCLQRKDDGLLTSLFKKMPFVIWHRIIHEHYCLPELLDFSSRHIRLTTLYQEELRESGVSNRITRSILGAFVNTCVERQLFEIYGRDDELILVDEGFCHRFFTLYGNLSLSCNQDTMSDYVELLPPIQGAIFIATPAALCVDRMKKRKRFPVLFNPDDTKNQT
ncbi:MAG: hypothetical protein D3922_02020, partial [Candidatus Electrothrix sp. AR1]|nr:hypothetical protein [Candidatus Electrothrix sp. AR1]